MGRIGKLRLAGLLLSVALLAAACHQRAEPSRTPAGAPSTSAAALATPTTAALDKPCLREVGSARPFRFRTSAGAMLVGVVLGRGPTGLIFAHAVVPTGSC